MSPKIVTIGASAGGLSAIENFFKPIPDKSNASFIIVQHLSPDFKSMMAQLLSSYTNLKIKEVSHGMQIEKNVIYLIPAGHLMTIEKDTFQLERETPT